MADAADAPLITPEMRATVGVRSEPRRLEVDRTAVRMFARAVGHTDLVYYDEAEAKAAGYRDLPCPPGYLGTPVFDPRRAEANPATPSGPQPSRPLKRILNGGTEVEYLGDICAGDTLTAVGYTADMTERKGSLGPMLIVTSKTEYTNQDGQLVAVATGTLIRY